MRVSIPKDSFRELVLRFHHVGPGDQTHVVRSSDQHL